MKKLTTRRRFHPYTSRKNMKRALGVKQHGAKVPSSMGFGDMGLGLSGGLMAAMLIAQRSARGR